MRAEETLIDETQTPKLQPRTMPPAGGAHVGSSHWHTTPSSLGAQGLGFGLPVLGLV